MARDLPSDEALKDADGAFVDDHELIEDEPPFQAVPRAQARSRVPPPLLPPPSRVAPPLSPPASRIGRSGARSAQHDTHPSVYEARASVRAGRPSARDAHPALSDDVIRDGDILAERYRVVRALGKAGIGNVLLVRHLELGQYLLFKYLPRAACTYPETVARFLKGARGAQQLTSEHTARTIDAGRLASGVPYVVSEFLEGSDLRDVIETRGSLPISEAVDIVLQAAAAVAEAHRHGMVHGALNPATIFVAQAPDGSALVKVMEFGVGSALRADPLSTANGKRGEGDPVRALEALSCTAPEQIRRADDLDTRTDVWALGALLYEALTGYPVYYADSVAGILAMIVADPAPPLTTHRPDAPAALERAILRCLEKERSGRYASVAELAMALKLFASPESQGLAERITRTLGRSPRPGGSGAPIAQHGTQARALVHVPSVPQAPPPAPLTPPQAPAIQRYQAILAGALIACGLFGGSVVSALIARGTQPQTVTVIERPIPAAGEPERKSTARLAPGDATEAPPARAPLPAVPANPAPPSAPAEAPAEPAPVVAPTLPSPLVAPAAALPPRAGAVQPVAAFRAAAPPLPAQARNSARGEGAWGLEAARSSQRTASSDADASASLFDDIR